MAALPSAIIIVNNDLTENIRNEIVTQLHISEVISGEEFDARVALDSDYATTVRANKERIMVERSFYEENNREIADVVIFVKYAMAAVEKNNFGPPGKTYPVSKLYWGQLCVF